MILMNQNNNQHDNISKNIQYWYLYTDSNEQLSYLTQDPDNRKSRLLMKLWIIEQQLLSLLS